MQQTNKYKLNLIEKDDVFSPDPLNENMEKVEGALEAVQAEAAAETDARTEADAVLDQRVAALEVHCMAFGSYSADPNGPVDINLGFQPEAVLILGVKNGFLLPGRGSSNTAQITPYGFQVSTGNYTSGVLNALNGYYYYAAFC